MTRPSWKQVLASARDLAATSPLTARDLIRLGESMIRTADLWCGNSYEPRVRDNEQRGITEHPLRGGPYPFIPQAG